MAKHSLRNYRKSIPNQMLGVWPKVVKIFEKLWEVLKAREIFQNWLSATIKYILWKGSILKTDCIKVKCKNSENVCIEPEFYGRIIHNYYHGYLKNVECNEDYIILNGIRILTKPRFNGRYWDFGSVKFEALYDDLFRNQELIEIFIKQVYGLVDVRSKVVVDIGAYTGDSSIYFALRGAEKVYAVEPHPVAYHIMLKNIKLNNMENKIIPINAALASKPGNVRINASIEETHAKYYSLNSKMGVYEIRAITLGELISRYNLKPNLLKMDCEGCEFDVIVNDYVHVKLFNELIFEYHENEKHHVRDILDVLREDEHGNSVLC